MPIKTKPKTVRRNPSIRLQHVDALTEQSSGAIATAAQATPASSIEPKDDQRDGDRVCPERIEIEQRRS